ncbi:lanthionine synthetase LanC family protein [Pseudomonas asplenii]|uniref:lanthionine synthetase LanC family protein n=1 Tax=Pseudomonas asplenii TaxID=53407 RepID=UPI0006B4C9D3|nr:lanthionine synthetase LanC family protein [Pseudomonas fuscovaginae]KPA95922.1 lantibiotic modifying enzyme [Pseudomonas fuscovaginae]
MSALNDTSQPWWLCLRGALETLHCDAEGTLCMDGQSFRHDPLALSAGDRSYHDDPRVVRLQQYLYRHYYTGLIRDPHPQPAWYPPSSPRYDSAWQVLEQLGDGALAVQHGTVMRRVEPGEYLFEGAPARATRGRSVSVLRSAWTTELDPAFVYLFGHAAADAYSEDCLVRYYLAPEPAQLAEVVQTLSNALNQACLPYILKYPCDTSQWLRHDTVVLYIAARQAHQVHSLLGRQGQWLRQRLRGQVPLWAQPLMPGLGFAQDPTDGQSFGESRCRALALGLADAVCSADAMDAIRRQFEAQGIDWQQPHLEIDPDDRFGLRQLAFSEGHDASGAVGESPSDFLQEATRIGQYLCAEALWLGDRCTWITDDADDRNGPLSAFARTMNASWYDGTLGVAAFLSLLAEQGATGAFGETACGALRHALHHPATSLLSLYEGRLGNVTQGLWLAHRLNNDALIEGYLNAAAELLPQLDDLPGGDQPVDLMHGLAGAILGLLALARQAPSLAQQSLASAQALGRRLLSQAHVTVYGWHWPEHGGPLGLCGLSHGNAGIALAFAQLAQQSPEPCWLEALEQTVAYEAHWFVPEQDNWPYLFAEDAQCLDDRPTHCGMAWCHGAPGIALSRLALWQMTGREEHRDVARRALQRVHLDLCDSSPQAGSSYTLCHGPAGNADILLTGAAILGESTWVDCARQVAQRAMAEEGGQWRSGLGVSHSHSLGLMLGLAGTGYFLLRCVPGASVPGLLLPLGHAASV